MDGIIVRAVSASISPHNGWENVGVALDQVALSSDPSSFGPALTLKPVLGDQIQQPLTLQSQLSSCCLLGGI